MRDRSATILLIALLAVMTCLPLLTSGLTTNDDVNVMLKIQASELSGFASAVDSGRLQHVVAGFLAPFAYGFGHYWLMKSLALAGILGSVASMFVAVRMIAGSTRLATLAVVFFFAFAQNTHDHNLLTAYPFIPTMALTAFWLSVAAWWQAIDGRSQLRPVSLILFVCSLFVYENFLVYVTVFMAMSASRSAGNWRARARAALRTPHVLATVCALAVIVGFRLWFQTEGGRSMMASEQYVIDLNPWRIMKVIERFGAAAFPLHYSSVYGPTINDFFMGFGTFRGILKDLFTVVEAAWLVKALIVAYLTTLLTAGRHELVGRRVLLTSIALILLLLSNLPLAITAKYQTWAIEHFAHGYLTTYFAFFGVVILFAVVLEGGVSWLSRRSRPSAHALGGALGIVAFVVCYGTDLINAHVAFTERQMYDRWRMVDEWIASPEFKAMPEGSLVLAPSLFEHYPGTVHVFDGYWNQYVRQHGRKTIEVFRDRTAWHERAALPASADRLFFLELTQPRRDDASYLLFGRVMPIAEGRPMASRELSVLLHARADHFRLVGRLLGVPTTCRARLFVNDIPTQGTFADRFGAHLDAPRQAREWLWARLRSGDAAIDPESILITASEIPVDGSAIVTFGKGFHLDDVEHRWSEETAVATLRNPENRTIRADIEFAVQAPGLPPGSDGRLTATAGAEQAEWRIGRRYETRSMRIEIAPTSTIDVVFGTDVPRVNAPLDSRRLFLRFQPQIRVREVGCEDKE